MKTISERGRDRPAQDKGQHEKTSFKERIAICEKCKHHRAAPILDGYAHGCVKPGIYDRWRKEKGILFHSASVVYKEGVPAPCDPEICGE